VNPSCQWNVYQNRQCARKVEEMFTATRRKRVEWFDNNYCTTSSLMRDDIHIIWDDNVRCVMSMGSAAYAWWFFCAKKCLFTLVIWTRFIRCNKFGYKWAIFGITTSDLMQFYRIDRKFQKILSWSTREVLSSMILISSNYGIPDD